MAAAIPFIPLALAAVGTLMSAQGERRRGQAEAMAGEYNAQVAERNRGIALSQGRADVVEQQKLAVRKIGAARAAYGASGVTLEGSPLDILESSAANAEMDKQNILYKANLKAIGYTDMAVMDRFRGENAISQGNTAAASTIFLAAGKAGSSYNFGSTRSTGSPSIAQTGYSLGDYNYDTGSLA